MPLPGQIGVRRSVEVAASCQGRGCLRRLITKAGARYTVASGVSIASFEIVPRASGAVFYVRCPSCGHRNEILLTAEGE